MLIVRETSDLNSALQTVVKTHHLKSTPDNAKSLYRPFWLGKAIYTGQRRDRTIINGTVVFIADARVTGWAIIGAYQHRRIENVLDLRKHNVNFKVDEKEPEEGATVLEPLIEKEQLPSRANLLRGRRMLSRAMSMGKIKFDENIEYHLIYRPYWEIEFQRKNGEPDVAMVSRDEILVRGR